MIDKKYNKHAISPVVATALLIVVAVVSVVGFQTWFGDFSSSIFSNTETQSDTSIGSTQIDSVIGTSAYFNNAGTENISVTAVKVDGVDCNITTNATIGISEFDISSCLANVTTTTPEVVIYTNDGIYSEEFYMKTPVALSNSTPSLFSGTLEWNRTYDGQYLSASTNAYAKGINVDSAGNVYVTGSIFNGINDVTNTVKYDSSGVLVWNVTYDVASGDDSASAIFVDTNDNVYVTGSSNNGTFNYFTLKYNGTNGNEIWNISYDGGSQDYGYDVVADGSSNVYVTGSSNDGLTSNFYTIKYDSNGTEVWNVSYDSGFSDEGYGITIDGSGNVYVIGNNYDGSSQNFYTIKYDSSGTEIWNASYDNAGLWEYGYDVVVDAGGNVYVTGDGDSSFLTIKYNSSGALLWNKTYNTINSEVAYGIDIDSSNNIYVTGSAGDGLTQNYYTIKYDSNGNELLNLTYDGGSDDIVYAIDIDSNDNIYITGESYQGSYSNFYTMKYNSSQSLVWAERFNQFELTSAFDMGNGIAIDGSSNIYVTGYSTDVSTSGNFYTIKYDSSGNELSNITTNIAPVGDDVAYGIALDSSNNIYLTGYSYNGPNQNYVIIKYDSSGNEVWNVTYDGGFEDTANRIAVDGSSNVYVTGWSSDGSTLNYLTIKYDSSGNYVWNRSYDSGYADYVQALALDSLSNVYVAGYSIGTTQSFIIKYDTNGNEIWNLTLTGGNFYYFLDAIVDSSDNLYLTGNSQNNYYTVKYDSDGNYQWNITYDAGAGETAKGIDLDSTDDIYVTGVVNNNIYTVKYNGTSGAEIWNLTYDSGDVDSAEDIVVSSTGYIYITGTTGTWPLYNYLTIKYS